MEYDFHLFFFIALIEAIKWRIERNANSMKAIARISIKTMLGCYSHSSLSSSLCIYSNPRITGGYSKHKVNQKFRRGRCDFQTRHTPHPLKKLLICTSRTHQLLEISVGSLALHLSLSLCFSH